MVTIKARDIFPNLKRVQTVSELLLLDAMYIVGKAFYNVQFDASDVKVLKAVQETHAYAHLLEKLASGNGMALLDTNTVQYTPMNNISFLDNALRLEFDKSGEMTHNEWVFRRTPLLAENDRVFIGFVAQGYLQVVAHVFLYNYLNKRNIILTVTDDCKSEFDNNSVATRGDMEYAHLIILRDRGNKLLVTDDINNDGRPVNFSLEFVDKRGRSQDWAAYCAMHIMQGLFAKKYDSKVKYSYFKSKFAPGDVILVYGRVVGVKKNNAKSSQYIDTCYPAVVLEVTKTHISYIKYMCIKTKLTAYKQYCEMVKKGGGDLISADEVYSFPTAPCKRSWEEVGVEGYTFNEHEIIVEPMEDDYTYQYICTQERLTLNTLDTIYAVFEDRNVKYNKERFLNKYFRGKIPVYEIEMRKKGGNA